MHPNPKRELVHQSGITLRELNLHNMGIIISCVRAYTLKGALFFASLYPPQICIQFRKQFVCLPNCMFNDMNIDMVGLALLSGPIVQPCSFESKALFLWMQHDLAEGSK